MKKQKDLCVVIDTNVWVETRLLRSPLGAALLYEVSNCKIKIGLPEVIEMEIFKHIIKEGIKASDQIKKAYETIEIIIGNRDDYNIPCKEDFQKAVLERLQQLDGVIYKIPLSLPHARGALIRVMDEVPPNGPKNQQFKDSCIWEALLELSSTYEVHFITSDKGFFQGSDPKQGVASILVNETETSGNKINVHYGIESFLKVITHQSPEFNSTKVTELIIKELIKVLPKSYTKDWIGIGSLLRSEINAFLTEEFNKLTITFTIELKITIMDQTTSFEFEGKAKFDGECSLFIENYTISNIQLESIGTYKLDGTNLSRIIYANVMDCIGRRRIPYKLRHPLEKI